MIIRGFFVHRFEEKDLEKFEKKIVFDCQYGSALGGIRTMLGFNKYYDLGDGFIDEERLKSKEPKTIAMCFYQSPLFKNDRDRLVFMRGVYSDALKNAYPIFLKFDEDYFFLNELKFNKPKKEEEYEKVTEKEKELTLLMQKHLHEDLVPLYKSLHYTL